MLCPDSNQINSANYKPSLITITLIIDQMQGLLKLDTQQDLYWKPTVLHPSKRLTIPSKQKRTKRILYYKLC